MAKIKKPRLSAFIKGAAELAELYPEGAAIINGDGLIVFMNRLLVEMCGDQTGKTIGGNMDTRNAISPFGLLPDDSPADERLHKVVETQTSGAQSGIVIHLKNIKCPDSGMYRLMLVSYSGSPQKNAGSDARLPYEVLAARNSVMARIAAGVVHEANNHFGGISQSAQVLGNLFNLDNPRTLEVLARDGYAENGIQTIRDFVKKRQAADFVEVIADSSQKAFDVVNAYLDIVRASEPELKRCDINEAVKKALYLARFEKEMRERCGFREMEVTLALKNDLPRIMADSRFLIPAIIFVLKQFCLEMHLLQQADPAYVSRVKISSTAAPDKCVKLSIVCNADLSDCLSGGSVLIDAAAYLVREIHQSQLIVGKGPRNSGRVDFLLKTALC